MTDSERARLAAEYGDVGKPERVSAPSWVEAVLLGLVATGLGHAHAGDLRRGLVWWSAILTWIFGSAWLGLWNTFPGLLVGFGVGLGLWVASLVDAARLAVRRRRRGGTERKPYQRWWVYGAYFLFSVSIAPLFLAIVPVQSFEVPTGSMTPALVPGDHLMAHKVYGGAEVLERGRIVIFRNEEAGGYLVSRLLGLPGETIELVGGVVEIDGEPIDDPWRRSTGSAASVLPPMMRARLDDFGPLRIPDDAVFVMGDDRDRSLDSRMRGPVPVDAIHAFPLYLYWSSEDRDRIGRRVE